MSVVVRIPTPLQEFSKNRETIEVEGNNVKDALTALDTECPGIKSRLYDEGGKLRRFVNIYVNQEDVRFLQGEETLLKDNDEISIIPAIAGGVDHSGPSNNYQ